MRRFSHSRHAFATDSMESCSSAYGFVRKPCSRSHWSESQCPSVGSPPRRPRPWIQIESGRSAVIGESFCRSEPAAAFRGFGVGFFPSATSRSLSSLKPESGR